VKIFFALALFAILFAGNFWFGFAGAEIVSNIKQTTAMNDNIEPEKTDFLFATFAVINKLSGVKKLVKVKLNTFTEIEGANIKIKAETCQSAFENNVKNYIAKVMVQNMKQPKESAEGFNFYGYVESAFLYKNPIQNNLVAINFLGCNVN